MEHCTAKGLWPRMPLEKRVGNILDDEILSNLLLKETVTYGNDTVGELDKIPRCFEQPPSNLWEKSQDLFRH